MATQDSNVSAGLRVTEQGTGGGEGQVHSEGPRKDASHQAATSYVGPPSRLPKGQYSNADIEDAVQPVGEFARIPVGTRVYTSGVGEGKAYTPAPVGDPNSEEKGSGARYNTGKTSFHFIPLHLLAGATRVFQKATTRPVNPYPKWNWAKGMQWSVPYDCALRHLDAWYRGEERDPDTGESHLAHAMCNLLMLIHYADTYTEGDDRPRDAFKIP